MLQSIISAALHWTLSSISMPLFYWGAQNWTQHSRCGLTSTEQRRNEPLYSTSHFKYIPAISAEQKRHK